MQPPKYNMCPLTWSRKNWIIVSFSSLEFIPQVKIWYKQMTNLGYKSHHIVSLDKESYRILCKNPDYRVISGFEGDLPIGTEKKARNTRLQSIWRIRYGVLLRLLSLGYNVFISDSDSIWKKYVDLDLLDVASFDMFHSVGGDLPMSTYKVWGHVLAGGVGGYTSKYRNSVGIYQIQLEIWEFRLETLRKPPFDFFDYHFKQFTKTIFSYLNALNKTVKMFTELQRICEERHLSERDHCDDQVILNEFYRTVLNLNWYGGSGQFRGDRPKAARGRHEVWGLDYSAPRLEQRNLKNQNSDFHCFDQNTSC